MAKITTAEAERIVVDLKEQIAQHRATLKSVEARRKRHAYRGSQGEPLAQQALAKALSDEVAATSALKNAELALAEAKERWAKAQEREREQDAARVVAQADALGDELIEVTHEIATTIQNLHDQLEERAAMIDDILRLGVLLEVPAALLSKIESQSEAIVGGLGFNFNSRVEASAGAVARFIGETYTALDREPPERELSITEAALLRAAFPSRSAA
jgi:hypothetical protein